MKRFSGLREHLRDVSFVSLNRESERSPRNAQCRSQKGFRLRPNNAKCFRDMMLAFWYEGHRLFTKP